MCARNTLRVKAVSMQILTGRQVLCKTTKMLVSATEWGVRVSHWNRSVVCWSVKVDAGEEWWKFARVCDKFIFLEWVSNLRQWRPSRPHESRLEEDWEITSQFPAWVYFAICRSFITAMDGNTPLWADFFNPSVNAAPNVYKIMGPADLKFIGRFFEILGPRYFIRPWYIYAVLGVVSRVVHIFIPHFLSTHPL